MRGPGLARRAFPAVVLVLAAAVWACGGKGGSERSGATPRGPGISPDTLAAWMDEEVDLVLLDTQPESLFTAGHLRGAVWVGDKKADDLGAVLPPDPKLTIVVYNRDGVPPKGRDLAAEILWIGYPRVYWLRGGLQAWREGGYDVDGYRTFPTPGS
jgi:rhodanese-related sulfurtransferase